MAYRYFYIRPSSILYAHLRSDDSQLACAILELSRSRRKEKLIHVRARERERERWTSK